MWLKCFKSRNKWIFLREQTLNTFNLGTKMAKKNSTFLDAFKQCSWSDKYNFSFIFSFLAGHRFLRLNHGRLSRLAGPQVRKWLEIPLLLNQKYPLSLKNYCAKFEKRSKNWTSVERVESAGEIFFYHKKSEFLYILSYKYRLLEEFKSTEFHKEDKLRSPWLLRVQLLMSIE